ncbi:MAG: hypothetical protein AB8E15_11350 [Bdellovibrionales bacterium]
MNSSAVAAKPIISRDFISLVYRSKEKKQVDRFAYLLNEHFFT